MEALVLDKFAQNSLIHKLKTESVSVKFENAGPIPPLDIVEKLTDELKLKVEELERKERWIESGCSVCLQLYTMILVITSCLLV